jgi:hypothetical protein
MGMNVLSSLYVVFISIVPGRTIEMRMIFYPSVYVVFIPIIRGQTIEMIMN